ncbi:MAG: secretin and TonB N-terminal domain-containing protein [Thermoanaerobaculia bacterium]|nr:secretin and TonB N-terminal domain-containing protein [Thermoanaerobaculia bacterium]
MRIAAGFFMIGFVLPVFAQPISWTMASRSAAADERYVGEPISMSLRDADLVETLRTFSRIGGFNLIIQPGVKGTVTVELRGVPWDQALDAILRMNGLGMDVTQGTLRVADYETLEREARSGNYDTSPLLQTRRVQGTLANADAVEVARLLDRGPYLSKYGTVKALAGNVLQIEDRIGRVQRIARLVHQLDDAEVAELAADAFDRRAQEIWRSLTPN